MFKRGIAASFWFAVLSGLLSGATAWAKPADLPSNEPIECENGGDPPMKTTPPIDVEPAPALDPFLPAFVEQWLQHAADALMRPDRAGNLDFLLGQLPKSAFGAAVEPTVPAPQVVGVEKKQAVDAEKHIRHLFESADLYRRSGLMDAARFIYQRVHLLSPTSRLGQLAIQRLQEIESRQRDDAEEQSQPSRPREPDVRMRDLRNSTMPLGLVEVTY